MEKNCFYHKEIPTGLSCSRCNKPVCNKCTIDSLVGIKCKECGLIGTPHILVVNIFDYFNAGLVIFNKSHHWHRPVVGFFVLAPHTM